MKRSILLALISAVAGVVLVGVGMAANPPLWNSVHGRTELVKDEKWIEAQEFLVTFMEDMEDATEQLDTDDGAEGIPSVDVKEVPKEEAEEDVSESQQIVIVSEPIRITVPVLQDSELDGEEDKLMMTEQKGETDEN